MLYNPQGCQTKKFTTSTLSFICTLVKNANNRIAMIF